MTLLTRIEFIGKDSEGETVSGHKFDTSIANVEKWLEEQGIYFHLVKLCGLLPKDGLIIEYDRIADIYAKFSKSYSAFIAVFHMMNEYMHEFLDELYGVKE